MSSLPGQYIFSIKILKMTKKCIFEIITKKSKKKKGAIGRSGGLIVV